ncbi:hypothetical protein LY76DRAFT_291901 [Colletotrichum caudatum]|nr:hypothetical protein LY76DRAFT_291901 [Colletotrichum caudatum]
MYSESGCNLFYYVRFSLQPTASTLMRSLNTLCFIPFLIRVHDALWVIFYVPGLRGEWWEVVRKWFESRGGQTHGRRGQARGESIQQWRAYAHKTGCARALLFLQADIKKHTKDLRPGRGSWVYAKRGIPGFVQKRIFFYRLFLFFLLALAWVNTGRPLSHYDTLWHGPRSVFPQPREGTARSQHLSNTRERCISSWRAQAGFGVTGRQR